MVLDLDGTLLCRDEQHGSLNDLADIINRHSFEVVLATGRSIENTLKFKDVIKEFKPKYIVTSCGVEILKKDGSQYSRLEAFNNYLQDRFVLDVKGVDLIDDDFATIRVQEQRYQFRTKRSFYVSFISDEAFKIKNWLKKKRLELPQAEFLLSRSENPQVFFLDIIPLCSTKYGALDYIYKEEDRFQDRAFYFGDNGNDIPCIKRIHRSFFCLERKDFFEVMYDDIDWSKIRSFQKAGPRYICDALLEVLE